MTQFLRHIPFVLIFFMLVANAQYAHGSEHRDIKQYSELSKLPSDSLIKLGNAYFMHNVTDSAMVCYQLIINRNMVATAKDQMLLTRAYNNRGCVALCYLDYQRAYHCFSQAIALCDKYNINQGRLTAKLNQLDLLSVSADKFSSRPMSPELIERYNTLMDEALQQEDWLNYIAGFFSMAELNADIDLSRYSKILTIDKIVPSDELKQARIIYHAIDCRQRGEYAQARQWFAKMFDHTNNSRMMPERLVLIAHIGIAQTYALEHNYAAAIAQLQQTESMQLTGQAMEYVMNIYQKLSEYYHALGDESRAQFYKMRQLDKMDSINKSNNLINMLVSDLQQEELRNRELVEQQRRQRNLIVGGAVVLLLILAFAMIVLRANRLVRARNQSLYEKAQAVMRAEAEERALRHQYEQMLMQRDREKQESAETQPPQSKYSRSNLSDESRQRLIGQIQDVFNDPQTICQPDFTVAKLAKLVGSNTTYVSQVINEKYGKPFSALLGSYRAREACRRMDDLEHYGHMTIEAISETLGFGSRATFVTAFKREIGLTPSEYLRMARTKNSQ